MSTVSVNTPKTPATAGSNGIAAATLPNVCKMPGPPAPFVPTPLPNIGNTNSDTKGYSKSVKMDGNAVAVRGASFGSKGDIASKATGGGIVSQNTHGPTRFIGPGSLNVKVEGKSVHLLSEPTLNNCGPSGSPANSATLTGLVQYIITYGADYFEGGTCEFCKKGYFDHPSVASSVARPTARYVRAVLVDLEREHKKVARSQALADKLQAIERTDSVSAIEKKIIRKRLKEFRGVTSRPVAKSTGYMVGTMMCESHTSDVYVAMSGSKPSTQSKEFERIVPRVKEDGKNFVPIPLSGPITPDDFIAKNTKLQSPAAQAKFKMTWFRVDLDRGRLKCAGAGVCAGQRLLTYAGHQPVAMTEAWFAPHKDAPRVAIFRVRENITLPELGHGELVPSCGACQILLPFALCDKRPTC